MADLLAVGFLSMLAQVVLLRELAVASFGIELVYLLGVGVWLLSGAAGAVAGGRGAAPGRGGGGTAAGFLLVGLLVVPEILFLRASRPLFGSVPGEYLPLGRQAATAAAGLAPPAALLGWLFRRTAREAIASGRTLAAAYGWESAGGAAGSAAATGALLLGVPNLALGAGVSLASALSAAGNRRARIPAALLAALSAALLANASPLDFRSTRWTHPNLASLRDTPYGRVALEEDRGLLAMFRNDALDFDSEGAGEEPLAHIPALQLPAGSRMLVLGGNLAGLVPELRKHSPSRIDCVEPDRAMHEALARALPPGRAEALSREPVRVVFADPRRFLSAPGDYDLILVGSSETASGGSNRFFTEEFFRLCARRLSPGGVLALRLAASETAWGPRLAARNGGVHAALAAAFPDVFALPVGSELLMMGARGRLERDPATLRERLLARGVESRVVTPRRLEWLLADERVPEAARRLAESGAPANSDSRPAGYQQGVLLWIGMLLPSGEPSAGAVRRAGLLAAGLAAAALLAARFRAGFGRVAVAAAGGAGGMVAESVVLLRFQSGSGALYGEIGLLLTSFMAGLAAGAFAFDRFAGAGGGRSRRTGAALLGALALLEMGIAAAGATGVPAFGLAQSALWLSAAGALSASLFACASRMPTGGRGTGPFALYAADLAGGCAGSLVAGLLLVPLFGTGAVLSGTAFLALLAIACL